MMNIREAIQSNRCIRRKGWPNSAWWSTDSGGFHVNPSWTLSDLMAPDWEVQSIEITREVFWNAYAEARKEYESARISSSEIVQHMARSLGL